MENHVRPPPFLWAETIYLKVADDQEVSDEKRFVCRKIWKETFSLILAVIICLFLRFLPAVMQLNLSIKWPPSIKQPVIEVPK